MHANCSKKTKRKSPRNARSRQRESTHAFLRSERRASFMRGVNVVLKSMGDAGMKMGAGGGRHEAAPTPKQVQEPGWLLQAWNRLTGQQPNRILVVGPRGAGKTKFLYGLKVAAEPPTRIVMPDGPSIEFFVANKRRDMVFTCWDLPHAETARPKLLPYLSKVVGLIFMVDATNVEPAAREELHGLLGEELLRGVPLLVLANKMDEQSYRPEAEAEVASALGLSEVRGRSYKLFGTCCVPFDSVNYEALDWLFLAQKRGGVVC